MNCEEEAKASPERNAPAGSRRTLQFQAGYPGRRHRHTVIAGRR